MGSLATTVEEQIEKLKSRNMVMDLGDVKAKEILLDIGYYRLGFYWHPFEIDSEHNLGIGTKFSDIVNLYYLDTDLKNLLSKALNRIEINFRTQIIYYVSNYYKKNPTWFADNKIVSKKYVDGFSKIYNDKFKKNNKPISNHHSKHKNDIYAPAWKTLEFLTFGSIITLYLSINNEQLQKSIALKYGIKSLDVFKNYLLTILFIRNICAHSDLLFDSSTPKGIKSSPLVTIESDKRHCLSSSLKVVIYFLENISSNRSEELKNEIRTIFNKYSKKEEIKRIIVDKIKYTF